MYHFKYNLKDPNFSMQNYLFSISNRIKHKQGWMIMKTTPGNVHGTTCLSMEMLWR